MATPMSLVQENAYDILIEDADGRRLCLDSLNDLSSARERLKFLAASYPQTRLVRHIAQIRHGAAQHPRTAPIHSRRVAPVANKFCVQHLAFANRGCARSLLGWLWHRRNHNVRRRERNAAAQLECQQP